MHIKTRNSKVSYLIIFFSLAVIFLSTSFVNDKAFALEFTCDPNVDLQVINNNYLTGAVSESQTIDEYESWIPLCVDPEIILPDDESVLKNYLQKYETLIEYLQNVSLTDHPDLWGELLNSKHKYGETTKQLIDFYNGKCLFFEDFFYVELMELQRKHAEVFFPLDDHFLSDATFYPNLCVKVDFTKENFPEFFTPGTNYDFSFYAGHVFGVNSEYYDLPMNVTLSYSSDVSLGNTENPNLETDANGLSTHHIETQSNVKELKIDVYISLYDNPNIIQHKTITIPAKNNDHLTNIEFSTGPLSKWTIDANSNSEISLNSMLTGMIKSMSFTLPFDRYHDDGFYASHFGDLDSSIDGTSYDFPFQGTFDINPKQYEYSAGSPIVGTEPDQEYTLTECTVTEVPLPKSIYFPIYGSVGNPPDEKIGQFISPSLVFESSISQTCDVYYEHSSRCTKVEVCYLFYPDDPRDDVFRDCYIQNVDPFPHHDGYSADLLHSGSSTCLSRGISNNHSEDRTLAHDAYTSFPNQNALDYPALIGDTSIQRVDELGREYSLNISCEELGPPGIYFGPNVSEMYFTKNIENSLNNIIQKTGIKNLKVLDIYNGKIGHGNVDWYSYVLISPASLCDYISFESEVSKILNDGTISLFNKPNETWPSYWPGYEDISLFSYLIEIPEDGEMIDFPSEDEKTTTVPEPEPIKEHDVEFDDDFITDDMTIQPNPSTPSQIISLPSYKQTKQIPLSGVISEFERAVPVEINVLKPDGTLESIGTLPTKDGIFETILLANHNYEPGNYQIVIKYNGKLVDSYTIEIVTHLIPDWVKNNAKWWSDDVISEDEFISSIKFLIQSDIIKVKGDVSLNSNSQPIPDWVKNNAGWWADGSISEDEFVLAIKYLIDNGIIEVN